jgi:anti-anti-sigma factor
LPLKRVPPEPIDDRGAASPAPSFACSWSWSHGGLDSAVVHVIGELDIATVVRLEDTLREARLQAKRIAIDLHEVKFIDSAGVHAIVDASVREREAGHRLVLERVPPDVLRIFELTRGAGDLEIGADPAGPPVETRPRPHRGGTRFTSGTAPSRAATEPVSSRAATSRKSPGRRPPVSPKREGSSPD